MVTSITRIQSPLNFPLNQTYRNAHTQVSRDDSAIGPHSGNARRASQNEMSCFMFISHYNLNVVSSSPVLPKCIFHLDTAMYSCPRRASRLVAPPSAFPQTQCNWHRADVTLLRNLKDTPEVYVGSDMNTVGYLKMWLVTKEFIWGGGNLRNG
jgi:hypothetical protein